MTRYSARLAAVLTVATLLLTCTFYNAYAQKFVLRVNAGDVKPYTDKAGNVWQPGKYYKKGGGYGFADGDTIDRGADMKITGSNDPRIYQTEHYSMSEFTAEIPNGTYLVRLHFAETYEGIESEGPRIFDVKIQGKPVLTDFEPQKVAGGVQKALVREFKGISVTNGIFKIEFVSKQQNPEINGIEMIQQ
jgi:hypothetical protein